MYYGSRQEGVGTIFKKRGRTGKVKPTCPTSRPSSQEQQLGPVLESGNYHARIKLSINSKPTTAILDTGASVSFNCSILVSKIFPISSVLKDISEETIPVLGQSELVLKVSNCVLKQQFIVANVPHGPIILGMDFLSSHSFSIDFKKNVLQSPLVSTPILHQIQTIKKVCSISPIQTVSPSESLGLSNGQKSQ